MLARGGIAALILMVSATATGSGGDFRIETDVFVAGEDQPSAQILTLFSKGVVYDFLLLKGSREITLFDPQRGEFILIDSGRELKAKLATTQLVRFTEGIRSHAAKKENDSPFGTNFSAHFDEESAVVLLEGQNLVYRAVGVRPKLADAAAQYSAFADWYAQLNAARPGNLPPFGRMELNRRLRGLKLVPQQIERTLTLPNRDGNKVMKVKTKHTYTWQLSTTDRQRINDADGFAVKFRTVLLAEYWGLDKLAADGN